MESHDKIIKLLEEIRDIEKNKYLVLQKDVERAEAASRQNIETTRQYRKEVRRDVFVMFAFFVVIFLIAIFNPFLRAFIAPG